MDELIRRLGARQVFNHFVGSAPAFVRAIARIQEIARSSAPLLITGETGTGKELVARAVHYLSSRAGFPFVAINCGSLPESLLESELFGHERGAFTSATASRRGLIADADGGTIFLDEIDALPPKGQVGLLRVLQEKRIRPVGSSLERAVDFRIISATNRPVAALPGIGFRSDLFYRLAIFGLHLPPLRERTEDIVALAEHFIAKHSDPGTKRPELSDSAGKALQQYDWPGNVRELENAIIRAVSFDGDTEITAESLGIPFDPRDITLPDPRVRRLGPFKALTQTTIETFERQYLTQLMTEHKGNVTAAARVAGKERRDLGKMLKKYRLDPENFRSARAAC